MNKIKQESQLGMIKGIALGDAYGMPFEMMTRRMVNNHNVNSTVLHDSFEDSIISKGRKAGSITDDTLNSLMILEMLKENGGCVNTQCYLDKLVEWKNNSPIAGFVCGPSTSRALDLLMKGTSIEETGKFGTTNGAAMKIAPLGLVCDYKDPVGLVQKVVEICKPTHNTTIAIQGASVVCGCASYLLRGKKDIDELLLLVKDLIAISKSYGYSWPSASLQYRIDQAIELSVEYTGVELQDHLYNEIGASMETIDTIPCVIGLFYHCNGEIGKFLSYSSTLGGDTDTIGAIGGALCGAMHPELISKQQVKQIEQVNKIRLCDYLIEV